MKNLWNKIQSIAYRFFNPKAALLADLAAEKAEIEDKIAAAEAAIAKKKEAEEAERLHILEIAAPFVAETTQRGRDALLTLANVAGVDVSQILSTAQAAAEEKEKEAERLAKEIVELSARRNTALVEADRLENSVEFFSAE